ncbi:MAG TPA: thiol reductant ABC exporter subunit CydD [Galbitalea sp.]
MPRVGARTSGAGLGPGGIGTLYRLGIIAAAKGLALVVLAQAVATGIVSVIDGSDAWKAALAWGLVAALARGLLAWLGRVAAARAALGAKEALRSQLAERLLAGGRAPVGSSTVLATKGLDDLDEYYGSVLPAVMNAAVIPLLVGARILAADWVSAVVIVVTVPLIPVFMALVGLHTRERISAAARALATLSDHLVELARGLPVLVGLGRVEEQTDALERISTDYRAKTMVTLRQAFLSSLVLELISTISVAVVAVFVGLRLVNGSLPLEVGLLALILAPECYAPFRELGSAFHASENGLAALRATRAILDAPLARSVFTRATAVGGIEITNLTVTYAERTRPAIRELTATIGRRSVTAILGASGTGKSTLIEVLAGRLADGTDEASVVGVVRGIDQTLIALLPQHPVAASDTVLEELRAYGDGIPCELLDSRIDELCGRLGLGGLLQDDPAQLSPGELRRVALVRALLRVDAGAEVLLLDEPTAHLDAASSAAVLRELEELRGTITMVIVSHDAKVTALADHHIVVGHESSAAPVAAALGSATARGGSIANAAAVPSEPVATSGGKTTSTIDALRMLAGFVSAARARFLSAAILGLGATLFAVSLTAVSGWLIVRASEHPAIMYLMVAIVGVRFFGIGRSVLRYAEQLASHDAILRSTDLLRLRIWRSIASLGASSRKLLRGGTTIDYLVITTDRIRDLAPRVVLPIATGVLTAAAAIVATALLHAPAVPLLAASLGACLVVAPFVAIRADRHAGIDRARIASRVSRRFAALVAAAVDLRANGVDASARRELATLDRAASAKAARSARAMGIGHAIVVLVSCATAVLMLPVALPAVRAGTLPGEIVAVVVLLPLAMIEPLLAVVSAVQLWPTLAAALATAAGVTDAGVVAGLEEERAHADAEFASGSAAVTGALATLPAADSGLRLSSLAARWPGARHPVFSGLTATAAPGDWLVVEGPSGSGKSTLLTLLLGYLAPDAGEYALDGIDTRAMSGSELHSRIAWSPQDAHLFDSTLRANLLLARPRDDAPTEAELAGVLRRVGLGDLLDSLPAGLDTPVGSEGSHLSGGQRQRVAVARTLLTRADVVLLDEPTAHLDSDTAAALMTDLRSATHAQVTVLVTHRGADIHDTDRIVDLAALPASVDVSPATDDAPPASASTVRT